METRNEGRKIYWVTTAFMLLFHIGAVAAFFTFSWRSLFAALILYWVSGSLGIGVGYHRLLTHRGFKVPKLLEYFFAVCGTLALQGGPIFWVGLHRVHHAKSDKEGDPHSPKHGFFWSHVGWVLYGEGLHNDHQRLSRYVPDLAKDRFYIWLSKYHYLPQLILGFVLYGIGGFPMVLWGIFLRTVVVLHITWFVNSASHVWGYQRFASNDDSRNNWWVALLAFGEGWHNNHHAHAASARHGLAWYEFDSNWLVIRFLQLIGVARNVRTISLATASRQLSDVTEPALQSAG